MFELGCPVEWSHVQMNGVNRLKFLPTNYILLSFNCQFFSQAKEMPSHELMVNSFFPPIFAVFSSINGLTV